MDTVLQTAFPVFTVILTGFIAARFKIISDDDITALNRFVFRIAMPVAVFGLTARTAPLKLADLHYAFTYLVAGCLSLSLAYFIGRIIFSLSPPEAGLHGFAATFGNAIFLGLPIAQSLEGWSRPFIILMLMEGIVMLTIFSILIEAPGYKEVKNQKSKNRPSLLNIIKRPLKNPIVVGALAGFFYSMTNIGIALPINNFLDLLGRAAGPVALFSLGLFLAKQKMTSKTFYNWPIFHIIIFKLGLLPLLFFTGLRLGGSFSDEQIGAALLFTLVPTGILVYLQANQRGYYIDKATSAIAATTLLSILTISFALYFYG